MVHQTRFLIVVALVLLVAGVAAAQSLLAGPSPGLAGDGTTVAQSTSQGSTATPTTPSTTTPSTPAPTTPSGGTGTTTPGPSTGPTTGGTLTPTTPTTGTPGSPGTSGLTVEQIVSLTRTVDASVPSVNAFTVPAGRLFVVTDVLVTNTGTAPACGASITASGATSNSGTGVLCVPAQASLNLGLTTGMEFDAGQNVVLANAPPTGGGALHYHLRGFLAAPGT
jgi:hypothetical protein